MLESSSSTADWCNSYFHRQMALPGLDSTVRNSFQSTRQSEYPVRYPLSNPCCCCHCHSNCGIPERRLPYRRCQVTELPEDTVNSSTNAPRDSSEMNIEQIEDNTARNPCTDIVPMYPSDGTTPANSTNINRSSSIARNVENSVSLLTYTRHQDFISPTTDQTQSPEQNNQITPCVHNGTTSIASNRQHSCNRRCHHECHHSGTRTRPRRSRTGMATMMPLSAWNLRRMQYPLPLEPPPPYRPWQLPPYLENDPAPSYRSRATTPANSVDGASE